MQKNTSHTSPLTANPQNAKGGKDGGLLSLSTTKRKPGRPRNPPKPTGTDPTQPLPDPKEEKFAHFRAQKIAASKAYQIAINPKCRSTTARRRASELYVRPDLASRINYLQATDYAPRRGRPPIDPTPAAPRQTPQDAPSTPRAAADDDTILITRDELNRKISQAVRQAVTATEKTQAVKLAREMLRFDHDDDAPVDPVALVGYLVTIGGRTPGEIAGQAGGLRRMLESVAEYAKTPPSTLIRALSRWLRDLRATPKDACDEETQTGEHLLPDGQSDNIDDSSHADAPPAPAGVGGGGQEATPIGVLDPLQTKLEK